MFLLFTFLLSLCALPVLAQETDSFPLESFVDEISDNMAYQADMVNAAVNTEEAGVQFNKSLHQLDLTDMAKQLKKVDQNSTQTIQSANQILNTSVRNSYHDTLDDVSIRLNNMASTQNNSQKIIQGAKNMRNGIHSGNSRTYNSGAKTVSKGISGLGQSTSKVLSGNTASRSTSSSGNTRSTSGGGSNQSATGGSSNKKGGSAQQTDSGNSDNTGAKNKKTADSNNKSTTNDNKKTSSSNDKVKEQKQEKPKSTLPKSNQSTPRSSGSYTPKTSSTYLNNLLTDVQNDPNSASNAISHLK